MTVFNQLLHHHDIIFLLYSISQKCGMLRDDGFIFLLQRMTIPEILESDWFKKGYKPPQFEQDNNVNLDDIDAIFDDSEVIFFIYSFPVIWPEIIYFAIMSCGTTDRMFGQSSCLMIKVYDSVLVLRKYTVNRKQNMNLCPTSSHYLICYV